MSAGEVPQDRRRVKLFVGLVVAGLFVVVGLIVFSLVSLMAVVFFSASQASCVGPGNDGSTGGDSGVPLPASDPSARLQVSIFSWNSYYKNSLGNVLDGFRAIEAAGGDAGGLQEQNSHVKLVTLQRRLAPTWTFVGTQTRHPIAYRTANYQLLASGVEIELTPHKMESGPGGRSVGTKYVVWAELRDVHTRATFVLVNDHKVAGVEHSGHPRKDKPIRVRLWHQQDAAVGRVITRLKPLGVPIFKTADENLAAKADAKVRDKGFAYVQMQKRGMYSNWRVLGYPKKGTHGTRAIDYVWATTNLAAPVRQRILPAFGSDHHPLVVDLDNAKATGNAQALAQAAAEKARSANEQISLRSTAAGSTTTADETAVWRALLGSGFDAVHAAAAMGNMKDESGFDPQIIQGGGHSTRPAAAGGGGYGLVQWTPGRKLSDYIGSATPTVQNEVTALKAQLDGRGPHPEKAAGDAFWAAHDTATAAAVFHLRYERSASKDSSHRVSNALDIERRMRGVAGSSLVGEDQPSCPDPADSGDPGLAGIGSGPCPLDAIHAPGKKGSRSCGEALTWLSGQMSSGSHAWYRKCMALVAVAYGWQYSGNDTAYLGAKRVIAAGQMHTSRTNIPKGAVLWWDGHRTGNAAGHVAIYDGNGYIFSNDVKGAGTVGRVPWTFPEDHWGQRFMGWSAPYFPNAG